MGRAASTNLKTWLNLLLLPLPSEQGELLWPNRIPGKFTDCACDHKSPFSAEHPGLTHTCRDAKMPPLHLGAERPLVPHGVC